MRVKWKRYVQLQRLQLAWWVLFEQTGTQHMPRTLHGACTKQTTPTHLININAPTHLISAPTHLINAPTHLVNINAPHALAIQPNSVQ